MKFIIWFLLIEVDPWNNGWDFTSRGVSAELWNVGKRRNGIWHSKLEFLLSALQLLCYKQWSENLNLLLAYHIQHYAPWQTGLVRGKIQPSNFEHLQRWECLFHHAQEAHLLQSSFFHLGMSLLSSSPPHCCHILHFHPYSKVRSPRISIEMTLFKYNSSLPLFLVLYENQSKHNFKVGQLI